MRKCDTQHFYDKSLGLPTPKPPQPLVGNVCFLTVFFSRKALVKVEGLPFKRYTTTLGVVLTSYVPDVVPVLPPPIALPERGGRRYWRYGSESY